MADRYGETLEHDQRHPLLRTITIPSSTLRNNELEILIQAINPSQENISLEAHNLLMPGLEIRNSSVARYSVIRYPVHKALILGEGPSSFPTYTTITKTQYPEGEMLKGAMCTSWIDTLEHESNALVVPVNIDHAEAALTTFRQSVDNSVSYEHTWFSSGVHNLSRWMLAGLETSKAIKPILRNLIFSLLSATQARIVASEQEHLRKLAFTAISSSTRSDLLGLITAWSERAHAELRDHLSFAFSSPGWRKSAWWKLFWRVDDVAMISSDIIDRYWLTGTEKELIWMVGRIEQAGLIPGESDLLSSSRSAPTLPPSKEVDVQNSAILTTGAGQTGFNFSDIDITTTPTISLGRTEYPQTITVARATLSNKTIPPLQSLAQKLVLQSLSTTLLTSSLSALVFVSSSTTSLYEAGTIAAVGAVYSLWRLQKRWEAARAVWVGAIREEGRRVLRDAETLWRGVVDHGAQRGSPNDAGIEERKLATTAVGRVRKALEDVESKSKSLE